MGSIIITAISPILTRVSILTMPVVMLAARRIAGTMDKITLSEGDVVQPGQTILSVNNLGELWITANLEETKIGRIEEGAKVKVTIDSWPGKAFSGTVEMIRSGILPPSFQIGYSRKPFSASRSQ